MKITELFSIYTSNEELEVLKKMHEVAPIETYSLREQVVIENLIRKSLVIKIMHEDSYMVIKNEYSTTA